MNHSQIEPEHLLVALIEQREGIIPELLRKMSADPATVGRGARELLTQVPRPTADRRPGCRRGSSWWRTRPRPKPIA